MLRMRCLPVSLLSTLVADCAASPARRPAASGFGAQGGPPSWKHPVLAVRVARHMAPGDGMHCERVPAATVQTTPRR